MPGATDRAKIESYVYANFCARQVHNNFYENCCYLQLNVALAWVARSFARWTDHAKCDNLEEIKKAQSLQSNSGYPLVAQLGTGTATATGTETGTSSATASSSSSSKSSCSGAGVCLGRFGSVCLAIAQIFNSIH